MNNEDFKKAIELDNRLKELEKARKKISSKPKAQLFFVLKIPDHCCSYYDVIPIERLSSVEDILKRHEEQIRQEIDEEIEKVRKQIEEL